VGDGHKRLSVEYVREVVELAREGEAEAARCRAPPATGWPGRDLVVATTTPSRPPHRQAGRDLVAVTWTSARAQASSADRLGVAPAAYVVADSVALPKVGVSLGRRRPLRGGFCRCAGARSSKPGRDGCCRTRCADLDVRRTWMPCLAAAQADDHARHVHLSSGWLAEARTSSKVTGRPMWPLCLLEVMLACYITASSRACCAVVT